MNNLTEGVYEGVVKFFKEKEGYGFVWLSDQMKKEEIEREEIFFHTSGVLWDTLGSQTNKKLYPGDKISFEMSDGPKGPQGSNIRIIQSVRQQRQTSLVAKNMTIGVPKEDFETLDGIFTTLLKNQKNLKNMTPAEISALTNHHKNISSVLNNMKTSDLKRESGNHTGNNVSSNS